MTEMGSFIELEYPKGKEYYRGGNVVRLNSGRASIYHAVQAYGCKKVYLPLYQCETVKNFLLRKKIEVDFYRLDENLMPVMEINSNDSAILIVNYYGIMNESRMSLVSKSFQNVIVDNSQAFFARPLDKCLNVYSARKFFGVPDGAYVIGEPFVYDDTMYNEDFSSDTSLYLLQRIEYGCEGKAYLSRALNEQRIDDSDVLKMSKLTKFLLDGIDYELVKRKRRENFAIVHALLKDKNLFDVEKFYDDSCVPMIYPFMSKKEGLLNFLLSNKHFQGNWWRYILDLSQEGMPEYDLSKYMIPITIDQRYAEIEERILCRKILDFVENQ